MSVHMQQEQIPSINHPQRSVRTDSPLWHDADCACTSWARDVCQRCCLSSCPSAKSNIKKRAPVPEIVKIASLCWAACVLSIIYEPCPHSVLGSHAPFPVTLLYTRRSSTAVCCRIFRSIFPHVVFFDSLCLCHSERCTALTPCKVAAFKHSAYLTHKNPAVAVHTERISAARPIPRTTQIWTLSNHDKQTCQNKKK